CRMTGRMYYLSCRRLLEAHQTATTVTLCEIIAVTLREVTTVTLREVAGSMLPCAKRHDGFCNCASLRAE
ncbi:MAG: hypothetical protein AB7V33_06480, partial [Halothiobacillus sp.]